METLEKAERAVARQVLEYTRALDCVGRGDQLLQFTVEEEQALEGNLNDAVSAYRSALQDAEEWILEVTDPSIASTHRQRLAHCREVEKTHLIDIRKLLMAYRQKAKVERLNRARESVMQAGNSSSSNKTTATRTGSSVDVMAALKRTRRVMAEEIDRVGSVTKVLDDGRSSLKSSHDEFGSVTAEIAEVRKRLKALQWQARQDRMWIAAGIAMLASTVLYIVHQRTGFIII